MQNKKLLKFALVLSFITIFYNLIEGGVSVFFGLKDGTLALLGFGIDSFVEVLSGLGIAHMILRMRISQVKTRDDFERFALKITGTSFYILSVGLIFGSAINIIQNVKPDTAIPGIIVSSVSIISMKLLMNYKLDVGQKLNSDAIIADANCTRTCLNLSIILLISSLLYLFLKIAYIDILGSLGIAYYSFKEGKESFEKSRNNLLTCNCEHD
ncbi:MAG: cation transporter [Bacteroidetes bacterium]|nr:cation transporter [Bacteroidota bacterium]